MGFLECLAELDDIRSGFRVGFGMMDTVRDVQRELAVDEEDDLDSRWWQV